MLNQNVKAWATEILTSLIESKNVYKTLINEGFARTLEGGDYATVLSFGGDNNDPFMLGVTLQGDSLEKYTLFKKDLYGDTGIRVAISHTRAPKWCSCEKGDELIAF